VAQSSEHGGATAAPSANPVRRVFNGVENAVAVGSLLLLCFFPLLEIVLRSVFSTGVLGQSGYLVHLVLIVGFFGGMITARNRRHLSMAGSHAQSDRRYAFVFRVIVALISTTIGIALAWSALSLLTIGFSADRLVGAVPIRVFVAAMPIGYAVMALRFAARPGGSAAWIGGIAGVLLGTFLGGSSIANAGFILLAEPPLFLDQFLGVWNAVVPTIAVGGAIVLVASAFIGTPLFVVLAGISYLLLGGAGGAMEVIPNEGYTMLTSRTIAAIPLFTFAGYILSESNAANRLVRLFQALLGWIPGGIVIVAVLASAFFTSFTGASGVTILALGGLLYYVLSKSGHLSERFSVGILTGSSNVGLLFPPSLAIIIYGTTAGVNIFHLFLAGIVPGVLLVLALGGVGVFVAIRGGHTRTQFELGEAKEALREAIWEVILPVIVVLVFFTGLANLVETAAVAVLYAAVVEIGIKREISPRKLLDVALKCVSIVGGVLVILAAARGLSFYIIDAQVPMALQSWVEANITSPYVFLILLNLALLVTGCFMDIFSAILIVAPLVLPLGDLFAIHPLHLGIIFLANLGLGFITPPVGLDLFLSSYRFEKPLPTIYRTVLPFFAIELAMVLIITYVPVLTRFLPSLVGG
jgi:tripartite ATP-independent transporter DctM subunit